MIQGALASSAMILLKPFRSFANAASTVTGSHSFSGKLCFVHTANLHNDRDQQVMRYLQSASKNQSNTILLNAGQGRKTDVGSLPYDACMPDKNNVSPGSETYKIIDKGHIRTGIIYAVAGDPQVIENIQALSTFLKKEKKCTLVVCLSGLGYKNEKAPDDLSLAQKTTDIDVIIGGHATNFKAYPYIALNKRKQEVIIQPATSNHLPCGNVEIDFDANGLKNQINFNSYA